MDTRIIAIYCLCDDYLKRIQHREDPQQRVHDAEVMTIGLVAALEFRGNFAAANRFLSCHRYIRYELSRSRLSRRLHRIKAHYLSVFAQLAEVCKAWNEEAVYVVDSFPIIACDNYRIRRCRLYQTEQYRGYQASKRRYFYGLKLHLMVTQQGFPVEFFLTPAATSDVAGLDAFDFDLPTGALIVADKAYNNYVVEDVLEGAGILLRPMRKKNSKRPLPPYWVYLQAHYRKAIETTGSLIQRLLPKSIHATSAFGFELKVVLFVLAATLTCLPSC